MLLAMHQDSLVRAMALWSQATALIAGTKRTRAEIDGARRRCPIRRHMRLAVGANDGEETLAPTSKRKRPETWARRCPLCQGDFLRPLGRATAEGGLVKLDLWCEACHVPFVLVRKPGE